MVLPHHVEGQLLHAGLRPRPTCAAPAAVAATTAAAATAATAAAAGRGHGM
jgi:hypothetical protein